MNREPLNCGRNLFGENNEFGSLLLRFNLELWVDVLHSESESEVVDIVVLVAEDLAEHDEDESELALEISIIRCLKVVGAISPLAYLDDPLDSSCGVVCKTLYILRSEVGIKPTC